MHHPSGSAPILTSSYVHSYDYPTTVISPTIIPLDVSSSPTLLCHTSNHLFQQSNHLDTTKLSSFTDIGSSISTWCCFDDVLDSIQSCFSHTLLYTNNWHLQQYFTKNTFLHLHLSLNPSHTVTLLSLILFCQDTKLPVNTL